MSIQRIFNKIKKNKYSKYLVFGGFLFFFIKGLIWLIIIFLAFTGLNKLI